jgi:hypothetical protein
MRRKLFFVVSLGLLLGFTAGTAVADLAAYYPLDEGSGSVAADASGNGHDGEIIGEPTWVNGQPGFGKALYFNGISPATGWVNCGRWNPSEETGQLTVAFWAQWDGSMGADQWQGLVSKRDDWDSTEQGLLSMWCIEIDASSNNLHFFRAGSYPGGGTILPVGEWTHITVTFDGTTEIFYVNGEENGRGGFSFGSKVDSVITIGCNNQSGWNSFNGILDEVRLYDNALSPDEIQQAMIGEMPLAYDPTPPDGSMHSDTWASLSWMPGTSAVSHDIYFGENFDDVNAGTGDTFRGNYDSMFFIVGFAGFPYPDGLVPGTTYYWRVDEVNQASPDSPWKGSVWSFTIPSKIAYNPTPADGAKFIDPNVELGWIAGFSTKWHTVYFGDNFNDVENATGGLPTGNTKFKPGTLELEKTYYWRVDESDGIETHKGDIWSFTIMRAGGGLRADYYKGMNFENFVLTRTDPQINFNWGDPGGPDPAVGDDNFSVRWTGEVEAAFTETYTFYPKTDDGVRLWVDGQLLVENWIDQAATEKKATIDLVAGNAYSIIMEYYEDVSGAVAELRWSSPSTPKQLIPQAALSPPVKASSPNPSNGATDVEHTTILSWGPGDHAASHEVYFGTDKEAVRNATKASPEYKGTKALGDESYDPGKLPWLSTYYWRIDEVNNVNSDSPWVGNVWSFTTSNFLIVDDYEDYDAGANQIWYFWHDGLGYGVPGVDPYFAGNGTGAAVGDETTASYTEETIVHGGLHSMPLAYDNNKQGYSKYSEVELKLSSVRDWTAEGITELSLWFRGNPASVGSFVESPVGTYTMTGSGADIWDQSDEFHYAFKTLSGPGSIVAKVLSVDNTDPWAKAGVMIRETLDADSRHAMMVVTPGSGVSFQRRIETGGDSADDTTGGITAPYWVKIERDLAGNFKAYSSANGSTWQMQGVAEPIQMGTNVYIGLAVTAHNAGATCEAVFTNVATTGSIGPQWANQDIGIASNAAEPLYVAVSNSSGQPAVVVHTDPAAATIDTWTEWVIPLQDFADQGIVLTNVDRIAIGLGTKGNMTVPGGSGKMYFDDIRLYRPRTAP